MAHVQRRGSGRWRARYRDPQNRERSRTFTTKRDAEHWLDTVRGDLAKGTYRPPSRTKTTVAELGDEWLRSNPGKRPTTLTRDRDSLRKFATLAPMPIRAVTPAHVQGAIDAMRQLAPKTVRTHYGVLRAALSWAVEADLLDRSPCRGIRLPTLSKAPKPIVGSADILRLVEAMPEPYRPAVWLGALGLRQAEVFGLRVGSVDFLRRTLTVSATVNEVEGQFVAGDGKTASSVRTISLPQSVVELLAEHLARTGRQRPDDLVLQAPHGGPVRATNFRLRVYNPALERAGLPGLTFHRLRHSAGHVMRELGVPLEVIQRRLGHASIRTTADIYGSLPASVDRAVADQIDGAFRKPEAPPRPGDADSATS